MKKFLFNKALKILLITNGMILISAAMLGPIYALFVETVGGDLFDASMAAGIFALAAGATTLLAGKFADRTKRPELIVVLGYCLIGTGYFLYNFAYSMWFLFGIQILIGFAEAFYSPAFDSIYSRHLTVNKAGAEWGAWESINYFSQALGATAGGFIAATFGFHAIFSIMGCLCFFSAFYILMLKKHIL
jgi:DHA1 family multidrug resistance protein-like MFS transporter